MSTEDESNKIRDISEITNIKFVTDLKTKAGEVGKLLLERIPPDILRQLPQTIFKQGGSGSIVDKDGTIRIDLEKQTAESAVSELQSFIKEALEIREAGGEFQNFVFALRSYFPDLQIKYSATRTDVRVLLKNKDKLLSILQKINNQLKATGDRFNETISLIDSSGSKSDGSEIVLDVTQDEIALSSLLAENVYVGSKGVFLKDIKE